jgi:hypothetical protein
MKSKQNLFLIRSFLINYLKPFLPLSQKKAKISLFFFISGALPFVTASVFCLGGFIKWLTIISYCILCLWGLHKALSAGSPWQRRLCFALPFLMRVVLTILRITGSGGGNPTAMIHVFLQVSRKFRLFFRLDQNKKKEGKRNRLSV